MSLTLDDLSDAQREVVTHRGGPLLLTGPAGSGKTRCLTDRLRRLVEEGAAAQSVLLLAVSEAAAAEIRGPLDVALARPYEELSILTPTALCLRLLRADALHAGLDPFFVVATRADRVALLLERVQELALARHDFSGRPAALMASFVARIDALKAESIDAERCAAEAAGGTAEEQDFAEIYRVHDRVLRERGTPDAGELLLRSTALLREHPAVRARVTERYRHLLVDDFQDASPAVATLVELLTGEHRELVVAAEARAADPVAQEAEPGGQGVELGGQGVELGGHAIGLPGAAETLSGPGARIAAFRANHPDAREITLAGSFREPSTRFWRCANERTQAQSVAADIERLLAREGAEAPRIAVLVSTLGAESQPIVGALEERAIPHHVLAASAVFERAEVRDVLAWLRLLVDPQDAAAVVRALARPPVELRQVDLARVIQIARRRRLDMVSALAAAIESPQIPPQARERIQSFLALHRAAFPALDTARPDLFVHRLVERLGLRRQQLFAAQADVVERLRDLSRLGELAGDFARRSPQASARDFATHIAAVSEAGLALEDPPGGAPLDLPGAGAGIDARGEGVLVMSMHAARGREFDHVYVLGLHAGAQPRELALALTRARERLVCSYPATGRDGIARGPAQVVEDARGVLGADWEDRAEELFGPAETLPATLALMREELLGGVTRIAGRLGELRLDTDLDISHGVVRYLELVKLAALLQRPAEQGVAEALPDLNARLLAAATSTQREIFQTSPLDETLFAAEHDARARAQAIAARDEPSLEPFLPRRGEGLVLSASDIETYRSCPLKYKFARVFRIPSEPTLNQRFGIVVHQVLERFHSSGGSTIHELMELLEAGWRRGGFGDGEEERQLREKARRALARYHERLRSEPAEPVWFERSFSFSLGPHQLRGRVDRVDRLPGSGYELIDYKTSRPKTALQLKEDVQLSLYAVGAREAWQLEAPRQSYYYVLDDEKVPVPRGAEDSEWIKDTVLEVGDGILGQEFEPTPSFSVCSMCDYRIVCPAAEK